VQQNDEKPCSSDFLAVSRGRASAKAFVLKSLLLGCPNRGTIAQKMRQGYTECSISFFPEFYP
jgi:hypothetical protein